MNLKTPRIKRVLKVLAFLEVIYLITFFWVLYLVRFSEESAQILMDYWVLPSCFILPLLLFKNVVVAINCDGKVNKKQKLWLLIRCALYVALAVLTYPIIR